MNAGKPLYRGIHCRALSRQSALYSIAGARSDAHYKIHNTYTHTCARIRKQWELSRQCATVAATPPSLFCPISGRARPENRQLWRPFSTSQNSTSGREISPPLASVPLAPLPCQSCLVQPRRASLPTIIPTGIER